MPLTTGSVRLLLNETVQKVWCDSDAKYTPEYTSIFTKETTKRKIEEGGSITGYGLVPVQNEGEGVTYETINQGWTQRFVVCDYGLGTIVTQNMIDDNVWQKPFQQSIQALHFSFNQTREIIGANILNRAFNSSYTYGDGKELIATDHPNATGGTWSNELTTASDLNESALENLMIQIAGATNDKGLRLPLIPVKLLVSTSNMFNAERLLNTPKRTGTANNDISALYSMQMLPQGYAVNHYFDDADAWFILTNNPQGLAYIERKKEEMKNDQEFDTSNHKYKVHGRFTFGCWDPRHVFGSPGA